MGWMAPLGHLGAKMPVGQKPPANRELCRADWVRNDLPRAASCYATRPSFSGTREAMRQRVGIRESH